ncbi:hypothetical protein F503_06828 [Ophiostoma piceae UAMH 11346]|uniref:DUF7881 domain-containing protein n=1 Tax=Ophiostoma piceae (strain UAMH 11346) TaxID=1262450 RepID=S3C885_OPHP1|nr:hypothetical protein F503_06828 [Ophiostoma piceae UAMH 11346]
MDQRNVFVYDARDRDKLISGLCLPRPPYTPPSVVTHKLFFSMVEIIVLVQGNYRLENEHGTELQRDDRPLEPGHYYVVADNGVRYDSRDSRNNGNGVTGYSHSESRVNGGVWDGGMDRRAGVRDSTEDGSSNGSRSDSFLVVLGLFIYSEKKKTAYHRRDTAA